MLKKIGYLVAGIIILYSGYTLSLTRPQYSSKKARFEQILKKSDISSELEKEAQNIIREVRGSTTYRSLAPRMQTALEQKMRAQVTISPPKKDVDIVEKEVEKTKEEIKDISEGIEKIKQEHEIKVEQIKQDHKTEIEQIKQEHEKAIEQKEKAIQAITEQKANDTQALQAKVSTCEGSIKQAEQEKDKIIMNCDESTQNYKSFLKTLGVSNSSEAATKIKSLKSQEAAAELNVKLQKKCSDLEKAITAALGTSLAKEITENANKPVDEIRALVTYQSIDKETPIAQATKSALDARDPLDNEISQQKIQIIQLQGENKLLKEQCAENEALKQQLATEREALIEKQKTFTKEANDQEEVVAMISAMGEKNYQNILQLLKSQKDKKKLEPGVIHAASAEDVFNAIKLEYLPPKSAAYIEYKKGLDCLKKPSTPDSNIFTPKGEFTKQIKSNILEYIGQQGVDELKKILKHPTRAYGKIGEWLKLEGLNKKSNAYKEYKQLDEDLKKYKTDLEECKKNQIASASKGPLGNVAMPKPGGIKKDTTAKVLKELELGSTVDQAKKTLKDLKEKEEIVKTAQKEVEQLKKDVESNKTKLENCVKGKENLAREITTQASSLSEKSEKINELNKKLEECKTDFDEYKKKQVASVPKGPLGSVAMPKPEGIEKSITTEVIKELGLGSEIGQAKKALKDLQGKEEMAKKAQKEVEQLKSVIKDSEAKLKKLATLEAEKNELSAQLNAQGKLLDANDQAVDRLRKDIQEAKKCTNEKAKIELFGKKLNRLTMAINAYHASYDANDYQQNFLVPALKEINWSPESDKRIKEGQNITPEQLKTASGGSWYYPQVTLPYETKS